MGESSVYLPVIPYVLYPIKDELYSTVDLIWYGHKTDDKIFCNFVAISLFIQFECCFVLIKIRLAQFVIEFLQ